MLVNLVLIALMFALGLFFYGSLPDTIASHWNAAGQVDGYMSKSRVLFMPVLVLVLYGFFLLIPKIDPLRSNIMKFRGYYDKFIFVFIFFMLYVYCITLALNMGYDVSINVLITPALAAIIFYSGVLMEKSSRNWFIGIRTPWTLSSDVVWEKTHKLGSKLFKIVGVLILLSVFFPEFMVYIIVAPLLAGSLALVVYSYLEYRKVEGK